MPLGLTLALMSGRPGPPFSRAISSRNAATVRRSSPPLDASVLSIIADLEGHDLNGPRRHWRAHLGGEPRRTPRRPAQGRLHRLCAAHRCRVHRLRGQRHRDDATASVRRALAPVQQAPPTMTAPRASIQKRALERPISRRWASSNSAKSRRTRPRDAWCDHELVFRRSREVHIRRTVLPALYCELASMYPTVCTLMGLWRFVIAQGVDEEDATAETQAFLDCVQLVDLQEAATWPCVRRHAALARPGAEVATLRRRRRTLIDDNPCAESNRRPLQCHACFPSSIGSQPECVRTPGKRAPRSAPWPL